jgi:ribonuclease HI
MPKYGQYFAMDLGEPSEQEQLLCWSHLPKLKTCYATRLDFSCTNNIAEYEALLLGLRKLKAMGIRRAVLKTDSQVISGHIDKSYKARDPKLEKYLDTVRRIEASFEGFSVKNIPRGEN